MVGGCLYFPDNLDVSELRDVLTIDLEQTVAHTNLVESREAIRVHIEYKCWA